MLPNSKLKSHFKRGIKPLLPLKGYHGAASPTSLRSKFDQKQDKIEKIATPKTACATSSSGKIRSKVLSCKVTQENSICSAEQAMESSERSEHKRKALPNVTDFSNIRSAGVLQEFSSNKLTGGAAKISEKKSSLRCLKN